MLAFRKFDNLEPLKGHPGLTYKRTNCLTPSYMAIPKYFQETNYQNAVNALYGPWQVGLATDLHMFPWLKSHPVEFDYFQRWMAGRRAEANIWIENYPFAERYGHETSAETPLFVDIGGAGGHQCVAFRTKYPNMPGRVILQDLPHVIETVVPTLNIEPMMHDFTTPQIIKGLSICSQLIEGLI